MSTAYKHKIYTTLGTAEKVESDAVAVVTNSSGVPTRNYSILGKSIVWNQLIKNGDFVNSDGWFVGSGTGSVSGGEYVFVANGANTYGSVNQSMDKSIFVANHKYYVSLNITPQYSADQIAVALHNGVTQQLIWEGVASTGKTSCVSEVFTVTSDFVSGADSSVRFIIYAPQTGAVQGDTTTISKVMMFDLTKMFGAGNEPATAAEFRAMFPNDYYPYNAGELKSIAGYDKKSEMLKRGLVLNKNVFAGNSAKHNGIDFTYNDGYITVNGTATKLAEYWLFPSASSHTITIKGNTKYLFLSHPSFQNSTYYWVFGGTDNSVFTYDEIYAPGKIVSRDTDKTGTCCFILRVLSGKTVDNEITTPQLFNLTAIFGLGNEPSTVAEFLSYFPPDQYDYTTGEKKGTVGDLQVQSSSPQRFQLSDKKNYFTNTVSGVTFTNNGDGTMTLNGTATAAIWRPLQIGVYFIPVGHKAMLSGTPFAQEAWKCLLYDDSDSVHGVDRSGKGVIYTQLYGYPNPYFYVAQDYVCDNLVFKPQLFDLTEMFGAGNEPTTVVEFWQRVPEKLYGYDPNAYKRVNIPSSKYFPDGMKSAGSVYDEINFLSQKATNRIGAVDLGTLKWWYEPDHPRMLTNIPGIKIQESESQIGNLICSKYVTTTLDNIYNGIVDKAIAVHDRDEYIWVCDSAYTDAATFKAAMSGVMLYYELDTPVSATISPPLQSLPTYRGFNSFSAPNALTQNGPLSVTYYAEGGDSPEQGWLTSYKRKLYMGKNIEWNQLIDKSKPYFTGSLVDDKGVAWTNNGDGTYTVTGAPTIATTAIVQKFSTPMPAGHVYYLRGIPASVGVANDMVMGTYNNGSGVFVAYDGIRTATAAFNEVRMVVPANHAVDNTLVRPQLFDLTQMFGAGNEPKTPAEFWSYFDNAFYPYDAGTTKPLFKVSRKSYWGGRQALGVNVYATATPDGYNWANVRYFGASAAAWKQELDPSTFAATTTMDGVTITNMNNGYYRLNGTATAAGSFVVCEYPEVLNGTYYAAFQGHRVFLMGCPEGGSTTTYSLQLLGWDAADTGNGVIKQTAVGADRRIAIVWAEGTVFSNTDFRPQLFDLTQMFGLQSGITNIADDRINWIKSYATTHSAYSDRIYITSPVTKLISAGRNLYSGNETFTSTKYTYQLSDTELATTLRNLPNGTYVLSWDYTSDATAGLQNAIRFYRGSTYYTAVTNGNPFVVNDRFKTFTSAPAYFGMGLTSGTMTNFMLEIGSVKHAYEPYVAPTEYLIPAEVRALPGYGWAVNDICNTIIREGTTGWTYVRNVASVDMGTLTWDSNSGKYPTNSFYTINVVNDLKPDSYNIVAPDVDFAALYGTSNRRIIAITNEEYESGAAFAEALRGVIAVYEAQTPTRTSITDIMKSALRDFPTRGEIIWENDAKMMIPNSIRYSQ